MSKRSKTSFAGRPLLVTEKSGIRWGKEPSARNRCIGGKLRNGHGGVETFKKAVAECKGVK